MAIRMSNSKLEGKIIVLNYSFGPFFNEEEGGEDLLTLWQVKRGKIEVYYHPGEPDTIDVHEERREDAVRLLVSVGIKGIYTPSYGALNRERTFLGLKHDHCGGEHSDEMGTTDWLEYSGLCIGDYNWEKLERAGVKIEIFDFD